MSTTASDLFFKTSPPLIKSNLFSRRSTTASSLALIGGRLEVLGANSVNLTMQVGQRSPSRKTSSCNYRAFLVNVEYKLRTRNQNF